MKLTEGNKVLIREMKRQGRKHTSLSELLGIYPQNLTMWVKDQNIPPKYFGALVKILNLDSSKVLVGLKKDLDL